MRINSIFHIAVLIVYFFSMFYILLFSLLQLQLAILYIISKKKKRKTNAAPPEQPSDYPFVTIQLPVFNELYVVERLLDNIARIDYPNDRLEINVV